MGRKQLNYLRVISCWLSFLASNLQSSFAFVVCNSRVGARRKKKFRCLEIAFSSSVHQRRPAFVVSCIHVGVGFYQNLNLLRIFVLIA